MDINIQATIDYKFRAGDYFGSGPNGETAYVLISEVHGVCEISCECGDDGNKWINRLQGPWAYRETEHGIQYYDGFSWRYFPKIVQEQYVGVIAEREILGEE